VRSYYWLARAKSFSRFERICHKESGIVCRLGFQRLCVSGQRCFEIAPREGCLAGVHGSFDRRVIREPDRAVRGQVSQKLPQVLAKGVFPNSHAFCTRSFARSAPLLPPPNQ
jgi:hypothetical protein